MNELYVKNNGKYLPIEIKDIINKEMDNSLIVVKVGTEENPATYEDIEATENSFIQAEVLGDMDISIILTPYQIDVNIVDEEELEEKSLCLQISNGENIEMLENIVKDMYRNIKDKYNVTILPSPLKIKDYLKVKDVLKRCEIRKNRRNRHG